MPWENTSRIGSRTYVCGHCSQSICSEIGYSHSPDIWGRIYICHNCGKPTYFFNEGQIPGPLVGETVKNIPIDIGRLYDEARKSFSVNAFTASVMACRKVIMHIAVSRGAGEGLSFQKYVEFLDAQHFLPPDGKEWVDQIRTKGNEANHEIKISEEDDAEDLIIFIKGLLTFIYEFPSRAKARKAQSPKVP